MCLTLFQAVYRHCGISFSQQSDPLRTAFIPILQMRKLQSQEVSYMSKIAELYTGKLRFESRLKIQCSHQCTVSFLLTRLYLKVLIYSGGVGDLGTLQSIDDNIIKKKEKKASREVARVVITKLHVFSEGSLLVCCLLYQGEPTVHCPHSRSTF